MRCAQVSPLLSAYLDEELAPNQMLRIAGHLTHCPGCRAQLAVLDRVKAALGGLEQPVADASFWPRAYREVRRSVTAARGRRWSVPRHPALAWSTAVVAVLLALVITFGPSWQPREPELAPIGAESEISALVREHAKLRASTPFAEEGRVGYILTEAEGESYE